MALGDIGAAIGIAFTYFTIIYLTGLGGLFSERSGIVNIGLEGMMIVGTVTGSWGAHHFTLPPPDGLGWGLPWGPIMGLLIGMLAGATFATIHALATVTFRVDHIVSGVVINLVAVGLALLRAGDAVGSRATTHEPGQHPAALEHPMGVGTCIPTAVADGGRGDAARLSRFLRPVPDPLGSSVALLRREP